jgi:hypothetical protein
MIAMGVVERENANPARLEHATLKLFRGCAFSRSAGALRCFKGLKIAGSMIESTDV